MILNPENIQFKKNAGIWAAKVKLPHHLLSAIDDELELEIDGNQSTPEPECSALAEEILENMETLASSIHDFVVSNSSKHCTICNSGNWPREAWTLQWIEFHPGQPPQAFLLNGLEHYVLFHVTLIKLEGIWGPTKFDHSFW